MMLRDLKILKPKDLRERIISVKRKIGLGLLWSDNLAEELHKPVRRTLHRRKVYVNDVDNTWAIDLIKMTSISWENKSFKYGFMSIDVFSKLRWAIPLKCKSAKDVENALKRYLRITCLKEFVAIRALKEEYCPIFN